MWPFRKKKVVKRSRTIIRRAVVGFIIGGAISSIVGTSLMKERRREHLGEDRDE